MAIAAASISSPERAARVTSAPACASAAANARPMPLPAPVTSARRPSNRNEGVLGKSMSLGPAQRFNRSEEHTPELQSLLRISYAVFCLKKKNKQTTHNNSYIKAPINNTTTDNQTI